MIIKKKNFLCEMIEYYFGKSYALTGRIYYLYMHHEIYRYVCVCIIGRYDLSLKPLNAYMTYVILVCRIMYMACECIKVLKNHVYSRKILQYILRVLHKTGKYYRKIKHQSLS